MVVFILKSPWEHKMFKEWLICAAAYGRVIAWETGFSRNTFTRDFAENHGSRAHGSHETTMRSAD